jgi:predicted flap endonuclease-1-like 5' DNA nuclease
MHWLSFFVGILAGWIIEWLVDFLYTRKKRDGWAESEAQLRAQLAESQAELEKHRAALAQYEEMGSDLSAAREELEVRVREAGRLHADLASATTEIDSLRTQLAGLDAEKQTLTSQFDELTSLAASAPAAAGLALAAMARGEPVVLEEIRLAAGDDLTLIEGIGPKIQELLGQNGIHTFTDLAEADVEHLRSILHEAGPAFQMADPASWPRQARLAANRDWVRLQALKEQLIGGVRRPPAEEPAPADDLTLIEGVGPKIQELLNQSGIRTFTDLAEADVEHLRSILHEAGPGFQIADPTTWPRQARLAENRDWVRLQSLKEQLVGGVHRPSSKPDKKDDLTVIEGIGPKVSALLSEHGIQTFAQLAKADIERLQAILTEAGPGFQLASAAAQTWPEQARLAAEADWGQFHALKDRLEAGRGDSQMPGDGP